MMRCPKCKNRLLKSDDEGATLRTKGPITFSADGAQGRCYWCGELVALPLQLTPSKPPALILRR